MNKGPLKRFFSKPITRNGKVTTSESTNERSKSPPPQPVNDDSTMISQGAPVTEMDAFLQTFVYPNIRANPYIESEPSAPLAKPSTVKRTESESTTVAVFKEIPLPKDLWNRHILSCLPESAIAAFSEAYQSSPNLLDDYYNDSFNFKQFNPLPLLIQAKADGVKLDLALLNKLFKKPNAFSTIQPLHSEKNASWVIATLCGDIVWLLNHLKGDTELKTKENFESKSTEHPKFKRNIVYFFTFAGHRDLIREHGYGILRAQRGTPKNQELNHIAASSGFFNICDDLEKEFGESPYIPYMKTLRTTVHFYAYHGELARLQKAITIRKDLLTQFSHGDDLLYSAVEGGDIATVKYLVNGDISLLTKPFKFIGGTCFHLAAENGHVPLLRFFRDELEATPPQELSIALQDIPLTRCGISASWDSFWMLYEDYKCHPNIEQSLAEIPMFAIAANHVDFFDQFIAKFGKTFSGKSNHFGWKLSHYLVTSANLRTIRKIQNEYGIDLTEKNNDGETCLLMLAKTAANRDSELTWMVVEEILDEFNKCFDYQLHKIPDKVGMTLEKLIVQYNKEYLFPNLQFENAKSAYSN